MTEIKIETEINADIKRVWEFYTLPKHICKWNSASNDWHTTKAENNLYLKENFYFEWRLKTKQKDLILVVSMRT